MSRSTKSGICSGLVTQQTSPLSCFQRWHYLLQTYHRYSGRSYGAVPTSSSCRMKMSPLSRGRCIGSPGFQSSQRQLLKVILHLKYEHLLWPRYLVRFLRTQPSQVSRPILLYMLKDIADQYSLIANGMNDAFTEWQRGHVARIHRTESQIDGNISEQDHNLIPWTTNEL